MPATMNERSTPKVGTVCALTGRAFEPGERVISALVKGEGGTVRSDYALDAWTGPPAGCIAHWPSQVPQKVSPTRTQFPEETLVEWFGTLASQPEPSKVNLRFVIALLLMRHKRFRFEDTERGQGEAKLLVRDVKLNSRHAVVDPHLSEDDQLAAEQDLSASLGWSP